MTKPAIGDRVRVHPATTDFDRPIWTIRESGTVIALGRTRAKVQLDGSPKAVYTFKFRDLQKI